MPDIKIGWSQTSITPDRPVFHSGQIYPRVSQYVHDPVTATALALESGDSQAILLSMDITSVPGKPLMDRVRKQLAAELAGFDPQNLSAFATHTHTSVSRAPYIFDESALAVLGKERIALPDLPENLLQGEEFDDFLVNRLVQVAAEAWNRRERGGISSATDYAAIAFNRRPVFERDGKSETRMYGVCARSDFKRYEAGSDHSADMLYTWSPDGRLTGVAVCIPCPSQVFELHSFISADYWHYTRQALRETLGNVFVLPLCGAAGDQNPLDLTRISKYNARELEAWGAQAGEVWRNIDMAEECQDIASRIADAVKRGLRKARNHIDTQPIFRHDADVLSLPIRKVSQQEYEQALAVVEQAKARFSAQNPMKGSDLVAIFEPMGVIGRWHLQNKTETAPTPLHALRIGGMALVTCPFELFVEYSLRIKARAVSRQTVVAQLTDSSLGYLPTQAAIEGGSYSSAPASTLCGAASGDLLVEVLLQKIADLWA